jgi:hypothetical protein
LTESNHFLDFDFNSYKPSIQRLRFSISSAAAKAEFVFRAESATRIRGEYRLTGGLAGKTLQTVEANESVTIASDKARKVDRLLVSRTGFRDEKSFQWSDSQVVSIAEAPWVFEHAWDQLRRATSQNTNAAVAVEFHDGAKVRKIAIARSKNMNSEAHVFLVQQGTKLDERKLVLGFQGNRLAMFGIDVPIIGLVRFSLDGR